MLDKATAYLDEQIKRELTQGNAIHCLKIIEAMEKAQTCQLLTDDESRLCVEGMVYYSNQFPFSQSWQLGSNHFVKSVTDGLELTRIDNIQDLMNRQYNNLGIVAVINENRTGWEMI